MKSPFRRTLFLLATTLLVAIPSPARSATWAIISLNLDGSDVRMVAADPELNFGSAAVSNDGKMVAFDSWPLPEFVGTNQWIHVASIDGKNMRKVTKGAMPKWSPDGKSLAYQDYENGVAVVQSDGKGKEVVSPSNGNPSWIKNGKSLVVLVWGRNLQILDLVNAKTRLVDRSGIPGIVQGFAVSPDEKKVCYQSFTGRETYNLVVADLPDIDNPNEVPQPETFHKGPICTGMGWHPDGKRIVFCEGTEGSQIFILNTEDGKITPVAGDKNESYVNSCFSPDGKRIFCSTTLRLEK